MNELPKDWKWVKLGDIFKIERGGSPRPIEEYITTDHNGINWIKIGDTKGISKYVEKTSEKIKPEGLKKTRMVYEGDFILSNSMSFGKPFIMKTTGCIHDGWLVIRKNEIVNNDFLYYILSSPNVYQQFTYLAKGSTVKNLNIEAVSQVTFPLPPLPTQQAIVAKIEELFSELDKGIEQLKTAQQQLKTYRQSVLKWAFEGKLTTNRIDNFSKVVNSNEQDLIKKEILQSSNSENSASDKGELPDGWKWVKLGELMQKIRSGSAVPPSNELSNYPILRSSSVRGGKINFNDLKYIQVADKIKCDDYVMEGDLLFTRLNGSIDYVGNCAKVPKVFPNNLIYPDRLFRLRLAKPEYADYIVYFFATNIVRKEIEKNAKSTAGHMRISTPDITDTMIPLCTEYENKIIVQAIESRLSVADKLEENITQSLQQSEALRQSILKKAFEGRLVH